MKQFILIITLLMVTLILCASCGFVHENDVLSLVIVLFSFIWCFLALMLYLEYRNEHKLRMYLEDAVDKMMDHK